MNGSQLKTTNIIYLIALLSSLWSYFLVLPVTYAEESLGESIDCTDVSVNYSDDLTLTQEERLRLMDKALFESLNKFEFCQSARKKAAAAAAGGDGNAGTAGSSGGAAGGAGQGGAAGESPGEKNSGAVGQSSVNSVASSSMSGTDIPKELPPAEGLESKEQGALQDSQGIAEAGTKSGGNMISQNGKIPDDIPPAQNDDALAAQIRYAAENEPDPVKSKQLWNEYRKYKGLAPK